VELVSEDAERLGDDGFRDGEIDLTVSGEVEKQLCLPSNCRALTRMTVPHSMPHREGVASREEGVGAWRRSCSQTIISLSVFPPI